MPVDSITKNRMAKGISLVLVWVILLLALTSAIASVSSENTLGTDFFIYYVAGRHIITDGLSPYDESVGEESQMAILKHLANKNEDQLRYVYPPYGLIPILPLAGLPFPLAQAAWMAFTLLCLVTAVIYGFEKAPPWLPVSMLFLYPLSFGLLLGNLNMPVICSLIVLAGRLPHLDSKNQFEAWLLGFFMAWATIKPQFSWFYLIFFFLLALKKKQKTVLISFFVGCLFFLLFSFLLVPDWIPQWLGLLRRYPGYIGGRIPITPLVHALSPGGEIMTYSLLGLLFAGLSIWLMIRWWRGQFPSLGLLAWGGFAAYVFHPTGLSYDQVIFLLPVMFWVWLMGQKQPFWANLVWFIFIAVSWLFVYLSLSQIWIGATYYGLFFLFIIWLVFGFFVHPKFLLFIDLE
ncbi:hypothetical protein LTAR_00058 [Leptolinea tardivitalis]|nr:hypothetical protein LTAR_00058 [Leptolinea tardivitalis]